MKKWLDELLHVPQHANVSEKSMLARVCTTVAITLICLAAIGSTSYAYFSHNFSSASNQMLAAYFEAVVTVQHTDSAGEAVEVHTNETFTCWAELKGGNTYYITLRHADVSTSATGFVIVNEAYHSSQIYRDADGNSETVTFYLTPTTDQRVTFRFCWGISIYADSPREEGDCYIEEGETVALIAVAEDATTSSTTTSTTTKVEPTVTKPTVSTMTTVVPTVTESTSTTTTTESTVTEPTSTTTTTESTVTESTSTTTTTESTVTEPTSTTSTTESTVEPIVEPTEPVENPDTVE